MATDSFHMKLSKPSNSPAVMPQTTQMAPSHLRFISFNSSMPSMSMLLPRETISPTSPHAIAAANDSPTSTRHVTLPIGNIHVQNQE